MVWLNKEYVEKKSTKGDFETVPLTMNWHTPVCNIVSVVGAASELGTRKACHGLNVAKTALSIVGTLLLLPLLGCHTYPQTLLATGPAQTPTGTASPIDRFRAAFLLAYSFGPQLGGGQANPDGTISFRPTAPPLGDPTAAEKANLEYLDAGFSLVKSNCLDFFAHEGRLQQNANVFKDLGNSFLPIASGAVALAGSGGTAAGIISLIGAANNGVLNAVYSDFLFDASNIDDVRKLVSDALSAHEVGVRQNLREPGTTITFAWTTDQIRDHQEICQPAHILGLTRLAIASAKLEPHNATTPEDSNGKGTDKEASSPTGTVGNPPPAPKVDVLPDTTPSYKPNQDEVGAIKEAQAPRRTTQVYAASRSDATAFRKCLYPTASSFDANHVPIDAAGKPAPIDTNAQAEILGWMKANHLENDDILYFAQAPRLANMRKTVLSLYCGR